MKKSVAANNTASSGFSATKVVTLSLLGGLGAFVLYKVVKGGVAKTISNKASKTSFINGTAEANARQIHLYLYNKGKSGINLPMLREVLRKIPTIEEFKRTSEKYTSLYEGAIVENDFERLLEPSQASEVLAILAGKPPKAGQKAPFLIQWQSWAKRFKAGFDKTYTYFNLASVDKEAIRAVFTDIPTRKEFINTGRTYQRMYGRDFIKDLKHKLGPITTSSWACLQANQINNDNEKSKK